MRIYLTGKYRKTHNLRLERGYALLAVIMVCLHFGSGGQAAQLFPLASTDCVSCILNEED